MGVMVLDEKVFSSNLGNLSTCDDFYPICDLLGGDFVIRLKDCTPYSKVLDKICTYVASLAHVKMHRVFLLDEFISDVRRTSGITSFEFLATAWVMLISSIMNKPNFSIDVPYANR